MKQGKPVLGFSMIFKFFLSVLFSTSLWAGSFGIVKGSYQFKSHSEYQAILNQLKTFPESTVSNIPQMSRGQQMVEAAKAKNRAILAQRNQNEEKKVQESKAMPDLDFLKKEDKKIRESWKKEVQSQLKEWKREQEVFLGRLKTYQQNTFEIPVKKEVIIEKKIVEYLPKVHIVNQAFEIDIRDQAARPTCSAFAGIRALEILLAQNNQQIDLSEQYFYWASKPSCHTLPCNEKGSWVNGAFRFSQQQTYVDIPHEESCLYQGKGIDKNETQIPLSEQCQQGLVKVETFEEVKTLSDVIEKIKKDTPVILAARLSENFYKNNGLVTLAEADKTISGKLDEHALGHAFLAVGVLGLPGSIKIQEGEYCLIVANSWGKGWGAGGYSCLTEKWLTKFRQPAAFAAVTKISIK
jgi:hypothetical protein